MSKRAREEEAGLLEGEIEEKRRKQEEKSEESRGKEEEKGEEEDKGEAKQKPILLEELIGVWEIYAFLSFPMGDGIVRWNNIGDEPNPQFTLSPSDDPQKLSGKLQAGTVGNGKATVWFNEKKGNTYMQVDGSLNFVETSELSGSESDVDNEAAGCIPPIMAVIRPEREEEISDDEGKEEGGKEEGGKEEGGKEEEGMEEEGKRGGKRKKIRISEKDIILEYFSGWSGCMPWGYRLYSRRKRFKRKQKIGNKDNKKVKKEVKGEKGQEEKGQEKNGGVEKSSD